MRRPVLNGDTHSDFTSQISNKLGSPIATGSFGNVYRCTVEFGTGETEVAVKVFNNHPRGTRDKITRAMLLELGVWLTLKHPTIVPLFGTARVESPLLAHVSQWMSSGTLFEYLDKQSTTITPSSRIKLVKNIAEGLDYLRSKNVVHGGLHPGNVLIDASGNPHLADFGLAVIAEDPELLWNTAVKRRFDSRWRAPEVIGIERNPEKPTFKCDIYSFGSVMFFIISGDIPWKEKEHSHQIDSELSRRATPTRPHNILDYHWNLIQECWSWEPGPRPEAKDVLHRVQVMAEHRQETSTSYVPPRPASLKSRKSIKPQNAITKATESSTSPKNVIIFGETGAGKSSVINLMAGKQMAKTSPDMERCTLHWEEHDITFEEHSYKLFDTVGLEEPQLGMKEYLDVIVNAHELVAKLDRGGGIDLLVFCVRAGRVTATLQNNYRLFYEWLCEKKVPIVLVLTGLEREDRMEDWWERNKHIFHRYGINVAGHACITAANKMDGRHHQLYEESRRLVRDLVIKHANNIEAYTGGKGWYRMFIQKVSGLTAGNFKLAPKKKNIETVLTKRCGVPPAAAKELASKIRSDLGEVDGRK